MSKVPATFSITIAKLRKNTEICKLFGVFFYVGVNLNQLLTLTVYFSRISCMRVGGKCLILQLSAAPLEGMGCKVAADGTVMLTTRREIWYYRFDRTALGSSASSLVLRGLVINGGGDSAVIYSYYHPVNSQHVVDYKLTTQHDSSCFARHSGRKSHGRGLVVKRLRPGCRERQLPAAGSCG